jgi:hypothetical protein
MKVGTNSLYSWVWLSGSGSETPRVFNLATRRKPQQLCALSPGNHMTWGWLVPTAGLKVVTKRNILSPAGNRIPIVQPTVSHFTDTAIPVAHIGTVLSLCLHQLHQLWSRWIENISMGRHLLQAKATLNKRYIFGTVILLYTYTRAVWKIRGLTLFLWVGTLWRCGDGLFFKVPLLTSDALLTTLHPLLEKVLQTVDHFQISCLGVPFSWLEKPRNHMGWDLNWILCSVWKKWIGGTPLEHPPYSPDLAPYDFWAFPTIKRELRGKKFRNDQRSAARFREVGGALSEVHRFPRVVLRKREHHRIFTKFQLGIVMWVHELFKRSSYYKTNVTAFNGATVTRTSVVRMFAMLKSLSAWTSNE